MDEWIEGWLSRSIELNEKAKKRGDKLSLPFVLTGNSDDDTAMNTFPLAPYEDAVKEAAKFASEQSKEKKYVLMGYDGYLTRNDIRTDALFYRAFQQGLTGWFVFALRYRPKKLFVPYKRIDGEMLYLGVTDEMEL